MASIESQPAADGKTPAANTSELKADTPSPNPSPSEPDTQSGPPKDPQVSDEQKKLQDETSVDTNLRSNAPKDDSQDEKNLQTSDSEGADETRKKSVVPVVESNTEPRELSLPKEEPKEESSTPLLDTAKSPAFTELAKIPESERTEFQVALARVKEEEAKVLKEKQALEVQPKIKEPPPKPPTPEKRAAPFVTRPTPLILFKIEREMSIEKHYLMGKTPFGDPKAPHSCSFFVMGDVGKKFEVKLRQFPSCQCGDFLEHRLCRHIMFVMLRFFRLEKGDPRIWQTALLLSELESLLKDPRITPKKQEIKKGKFVSKLFAPEVSVVPPIDPPTSKENVMPLQHRKTRARKSDFINKLFLKKPKITPAPPPKEEKTSEKEEARFCPICLEEFNFVVETPATPYIGPIPWKPKFMPVLDMAPPKSIKAKKKEKAMLEALMKKHQQERLKPQGTGSGENPPTKIDGNQKEGEATKSSGDGKSGEDKANSSGEEEKKGEQEKDANSAVDGNNLVSEEQGKADGKNPLPALRAYEPIWYCANPECNKDNDDCVYMVHEWCYKKLDNFGTYPRGKPCPVYRLM